MKKGHIGQIKNHLYQKTYDLPDADYHLFKDQLLDESLENLFYNVETQKNTMNKTPNLKNAKGIFQSTSAKNIDVSENDNK